MRFAHVLVSAALACSNVTPSFAHTQVPADHLEQIMVPIQGTWVQGTNSFIFTPGDTRSVDGWIWGNVIGKGGQINRYIWRSNGSAWGTLYFEVGGNRQGPIDVQLLAGNGQMRWSFGAENLMLVRIN